MATQPPPPGIVDVTLHNAGAATLQAGVATFAQLFAPGDLPAGQGLVARINGVSVPVQIDVKNRHEDGSVKHAVLSVERPPLNAGASVEVVLERGAAAPAKPAVDLAAVASQHTMSVVLTPQGQAPVTIDVIDALRKAIADGSASFWQKGELATQARVTVELPGSLRAEFDVTAFRDGQISVDAQFNNDQAMQAVGGRVAYDVSVMLDGRQVVRESVNQGQYQNWQAEVSSGGMNGGQGLGSPGSGWLNIKHDVEYLKDAGAVANYDLSIAPNASVLQSYGSAIAAPGWSAPLAANGVLQAMGTTGGRADIGFTTMSNTAWLMTGDARAASYSIGQAEAAGSTPWNLWDTTNKTWLNTDFYPRLWTDPRGGTGSPGNPNSGSLTQQPDSLTGWSLASSHQPDLSYVPYLLTGERWMLDNLQAQSAWSVMSQWPAVRFDGDGVIVNQNQVRGAAWSLRQIDNAAWISPDGTAENAWFDKISANNWNWLVSKIPEWTAAQGEAHGWLPGVYTPGLTSPWQQDYFASTTIAAAKRGNDTAETFLAWQKNFLIGRFTSESKGFEQRDGAAYNIAVANPTTGVPFKTWAEIGAQTVARGLSNGDGWAQSNGDYGQLAMATLAALYDLNPSAEIAAIYASLLQQGIPYLDPASFGRSPTYAVTIPNLYDAAFPPGSTPPTTGGGTTGGGGTTTGGGTVTPPPPPPPTLTPVSLTFGTGADTMVLRVSQDFWQASAQYKVFVNGTQVGGTLTASALRKNGEFDTVTIQGNWGAQVSLGVEFVNDGWAFDVNLDRNLFLNGVTLNGRDMGAAADFLGNGLKSFSLAKPAAGVTLPAPAAAALREGTTGADTLVGTAGADIIEGRAGNDVLTGGAGADTFVFRPGAGADRITDFASGVDRILFSGIDPASIKAVAATQGGVAGTMITYGTTAGDGVFLAGVRGLAAGDLVFANLPTSTAVTGAPAPVATATTSPGGFAPVSHTLGTGRDTLVLQLNQDFFNGSAQYAVLVNGFQVGGTLTASALRSAGQTDTITLRGEWGTINSLNVRYLNDIAGTTPATDRNLFVQGATLNGDFLEGFATQLRAGNNSFQLNKPVSMTLGTGTDTLVLKIAQDFWQTAATYTVSVNGVQIGGTLSAAALQRYGQEDTITLRGNWGDSVTLAVRFTNDGWGGHSTLDRNLYLRDVIMNGADLDLAHAFGTNGTQSFTFAKPVALPAPAFAQLAEGSSIANTLVGGAGNDILRGGAGADVLTGGVGRDTFVFARGDGADRITDFVSGTDRLMFQGVDAASLKAVAATVGGVAGLQVSYGPNTTDTVFLAGVSTLQQGDLVLG